MPSRTSYLELTLPEFQEFIDSWHEPVNQNMEDIDAWASDLYQSLVGSSATGVWSSLRGTLGSLAARLAVSINSDGSIDLTSSPDILSLAGSSTKGTEASPDDDPRGRFDRSDFEIYDARQPAAGGRFVPIGAAGPSASSPEEDLDSGIALRSADFSQDTDHPVASPAKSFVSGHQTGGAAALISAPGGVGIVQINAGTTPALFSIDGYPFRIREDILFDYTALSPALNEMVWIYVSRLGTDYGNANFEYNQDGGYATKDLRVLQSGTVGTTVAATKVFQDLTASFLTAVLGVVEPGDVLVITAPSSAAGSYAIDTVDSDTQIHVRGELKADIAAGATWHIQDNHQPNIGAEVTDGDEETLPTYVAGRVYIGRVRHKTGGPPDEICNFAKGGVWDYDWNAVAGDAAGLAGSPITLTHDLGVVPTDVQIFLRSAANSQIYPPIVERQIQTDDTPTYATLLVPSMRWHATTTTITIRLLNASTTPSKPSALYTNSAGTDVTAGDIRVIARR